MTVFAIKIMVVSKPLYLVDLAKMRCNNKEKYLLRILLFVCIHSIYNQEVAEEGSTWYSLMSNFVVEIITFYTKKDTMKTAKNGCHTSLQFDWTSSSR